jgi:hypothetical protein
MVLERHDGSQEERKMTTKTEGFPIQNIGKRAGRIFASDYLQQGKEKHTQKTKKHR